MSKKFWAVIAFIALSFFSSYVVSSAFFFGRSNVTDIEIFAREIIGFMLPTVCAIPLLFFRDNK